MSLRRLNFPDFSATGWNRVIVFTIVGTLCCIVLAFTIDSYSFAEARWRLGANPINDVIIPLTIAPPFFFYLLSKLRQLAMAHERLMVVASTDGLTSCLNRLAFTTLVDAYLEQVSLRDPRRTGALLVMDVDHFKLVNDNFGHDAGDAALRMIVQSVRSAVRDVDLVGRLGGEEFGVFLPGLLPEKVGAVADRIRAGTKAIDFRPLGARYDLSLSIGVVTFFRKTTFGELYKLADRCLYEAKQKGRDRVEAVRLGRESAALQLISRSDVRQQSA